MYTGVRDADWNNHLHDISQVLEHTRSAQYVFPVGVGILRCGRRNHDNIVLCRELQLVFYRI